MDRHPVPDERELAVERAGDRLAWMVLAFGILVVVAWRSYTEQVASWELLGLVVLAGAVSFAYRLWHRAVSRGPLIVVGFTVVAAAGIALIAALLLPRPG